MKKSLRILMVVLALALAVSMFGIAGAETEATATTQAQLYIGEYDADMTGLAHIVFGQVSDTTAEYGIILRSVPATEGEEVVEKVFEGKNIGAEGKFGIAVYGLPEGAYWAMAYTGAGEDRVIGNATYFKKGVAEYNVTYNLDGGESAELEAGDTFAQGTRPAEPAEVPVKDGWEFIGWNQDTWANTLFDFDAEGAVNSDITLNAMYAPKADETYRITLDNNNGGQYTTLTSAINPTLAEGEQVILTFDINKIYSNVSRFMVATMDIAHSRAGNWWAYNGVDTPYAHSSYYYANAAGIFDNYSGMSAGAGKVAYDSNGLVDGVEHWVADDGWYLTGGSGYAGDAARISAIPFGEGKTVKLVYTAPSADAKASLCLYTKATADGDSAFVLNSAIMDIPDHRADLMRTVQFCLDTNTCLDMNVSNLSCTTSNGQNLGVQAIITMEGNVGTIVPEEFVVVNPNVLVYDIQVTNNASTTGFGGMDVLAVPYGGSLVYEFDIVESNLGVQDVDGSGDTSAANNATMGWFGIGLRHSGAVSNWPWKMMYTNGSYSGISSNGIGGTVEYPMFGDAPNSHWYRLMETGANVKVVYTRATAGNSDGSFIVYKNGEVFAQNTGLGDITGNAAINFMWWDAGPRVLKVTNIYSYVLDANGVKGASTSPFGVCSLTKFVEVE